MSGGEVLRIWGEWPPEEDVCDEGEKYVIWSHGPEGDSEVELVLLPADRFDALQAENQRLRELLREASAWIPGGPVAEYATEGLRARVGAALTGDTP